MRRVRDDDPLARPDDPAGTRVIPTRSNPNRLFAAERGRAGVVGNTGSLGLHYSAETAETAETAFLSILTGTPFRGYTHSLCD